MSFLHIGVYFFFFNIFFKDFIYLFIEKEEWREKKRERNFNWLPLAQTQLGTAHNPDTYPHLESTSSLAPCSMMFNQLSHTGRVSEFISPQSVHKEESPINAKHMQKVLFWTQSLCTTRRARQERSLLNVLCVGSFQLNMHLIIH